MSETSANHQTQSKKAALNAEVEVVSEDNFARRHIGPTAREVQEMVSTLGVSSLENLIDQTVPKTIRTKKPLKLRDFPEALSEVEALARLKQTASGNKVYRSYIGMGYYGTLTPAVIARNILENPGWYTQYTPYQAEIAQGRLEALLNFQTLVADLTALPIANASLLDEATAAAEAMAMSYSIASDEKKKVFLVAKDCHPQTIEVVKTRAEGHGIEVRTFDLNKIDITGECFGVLLQYPNTFGVLNDYKELANKAHAQGCLVTVATDLLALCLLTPPGEFGADIAVGSAQRFGVPLGFGGPHAAFFATKEEYKRLIPGRIIGVSVDANGKRALRLALQTREQHIRREKATSNICTAQVLLAVMASMYAVYHGPQGLTRIAGKIHSQALRLALAIKNAGLELRSEKFFDTITVSLKNGSLEAILKRADEKKVNLGVYHEGLVSVALDETVTENDLNDLGYIFTGKKENLGALDAPAGARSPFLTNEVFNLHHTESEFLRYVKRLESKDLSLCHSMIPLGSCTMKLNATAEMLPVSWREFSVMHPFAPAAQTKGYRKMFAELERALAEMTGFSAVSLQPNAGSQGEYAGLLAIREYQKSIAQAHRNVCLIPRSAHGTNPASAAMAGLKVVVVECDKNGNIDLNDLKTKVAEHKNDLSTLMVTYPSTHGVFEEGVKKATALVHDAGGQVYMDGANMNALVGLVRPAAIGMDVCHFNLHKTFCIPHGGGGPGMGPIAVAKHLSPFLSSHPVIPAREPKIQGSIGAVSAAPWGSASILTISWMYIAMMSADELTRATKISILNANYIAKKLEHAYPTLYRGRNGFVAHECILDLREFKKTANVEVEDVAKRLMDYGFHAPTVSFPVAGTLMVEPTESENKAELDRFCAALLSIREEIRAIENGKVEKQNNVLKRSPHTIEDVSSDKWDRPYSREQAAFPEARLRSYKFWPSVARIDGAYGDRNLVCSCGPV
jgi:glycine dehydrogenase